jgi:hypothetical protein
MKEKILSWFKELWFCKLWKYHKWTSKAEQEIMPTDLSIEGYCDYATMYCQRCGHISELSIKFTNRMKATCKNSESK